MRSDPDRICDWPTCRYVNVKYETEIKLEAGHSIECITDGDHSIALSKTVLQGCVVTRRDGHVRRHNRNETAPHGCLVATFCIFWRCDLWPFDLGLIFIGGRDIVMDYPCAKFGYLDLSRFGFTVRTDRVAHRQNHRGGWSLYSRDY